MDRNYAFSKIAKKVLTRSLSARRAWIEISGVDTVSYQYVVALRKESVDRNKSTFVNCNSNFTVALRKESVDRNITSALFNPLLWVALRKESVDRNIGSRSQKPNFLGRSPQGERG